jgi:molybdopterin-containing oxidoreductase family membrane subunit
MLVGYAYASEFFIAWYSGNPYEKFVFIQRAMGSMAWSYWTMISCNVFWPQLFWFRSIRRNVKAMFVISILVNIGMWYERFVIVVTSLNSDFLPGSWRYYRPTLWDWGITIGSFGLFFTLFLLFCRLFPAIAMSEVKGVMAHGEHKGKTSETGGAH